jgi:hypothetical protein
MVVVSVQFSNSIIAGGGTLTRVAIRSPNYVATLTGWTINRDGSAEFNNVNVRGNSNLGTLSVSSTSSFGGQSWWSDNNFADLTGTYINKGGGNAKRITIDPTHGVNYPTEQWSAAQFEAGLGSPEQPFAHIRSPFTTTRNPAELYLYGQSNTNTISKFFAAADSYEFTSAATTTTYIFGAGSVGGVTMGVDGTFAATSTVSADGTTVNRNVTTITNITNVSSIGATIVLTDSITANVIAGRKYEIEYDGVVSATTASAAAPTRLQVEVRLTSTVGTLINQIRVFMVAPNDGTPCRLVTPWTAPSTGSQTFIVGMTQVISGGGGGGTCTRQGAASVPSYVIVREVGA